MDFQTQDMLVFINILVTVIVGVILRKQINSQKSLLDSYKNYVSVLNPDSVLKLKEEELNQTKKNMSNDIDTLKSQIEELSDYTYHIMSYLEKTAKELNEPFDREEFILNNFPKCRNILH